MYNLLMLGVRIKRHAESTRDRHSESTMARNLNTEFSTIRTGSVLRVKRMSNYDVFDVGNIDKPIVSTSNISISKAKTSTPTKSSKTTATTPKKTSVLKSKASARASRNLSPLKRPNPRTKAAAQVPAKASTPKSKRTPPLQSARPKSKLSTPSKVAPSIRHSIPAVVSNASKTGTPLRKSGRAVRTITPAMMDSSPVKGNGDDDAFVVSVEIDDDCDSDEDEDFDLMDEKSKSKQKKQTKANTKAKSNSKSSTKVNNKRTALVAKHNPLRKRKSDRNARIMQLFKNGATVDPLPGRADEFSWIKRTVSGLLESGLGGCLCKFTKKDMMM